MSDIEWTDKTWNPLRGCARISPGCVNCYAERMAARNLPELRSPTTGEPFAIMTPSGPRWTGKVELIESKLLEPLKWRKPQRVFVNSMSDLFHEDVPDEWIDRIFAVMALTPHITYQVLTKRAKRMRAYFEAVVDGGFTRKFEVALAANDIDAQSFLLPWPLPNVWLGVSVEDQQRADERIPDLLATPAAVRFVSYEPALGPVDLTPWLDRLDWVIVGGESGPGARPFDIAWARAVVEQCCAAGVSVFVKQFGAVPMMDEGDWARMGNTLPLLNPRNAKRVTDGMVPLKLYDKKGGNPFEWPEWARVREFPRKAK